MLKAILVPLDGSHFGEQALPLAISLSERTGATLHLVHVDAPVIAAYAGGYPGPYSLPPARNVERHAQERHYLESIHQRISTTAHVSATLTILDGPVAGTLANYAERAGISLIVMTTHGRGPMARFWLGSTADSLIRQAPVPLLIVRPREGLDQTLADISFRHVLIPLDGSAYAEQAIAPALEVIGRTDVHYTLARVVEPFSSFDAVTLQHTPAWEHDETRLRESEAKDYLAAVAQGMQSDDLHVMTRVFIAEHPALALVDAACEDEYDLIALATHGRGGFRRMLVGSVADKILRASTCPILIVRPQDAAADTASA